VPFELSSAHDGNGLRQRKRHKTQAQVADAST
jgi:hypothetical protein